MSTYKSDDGFVWDKGAQFFTVRSKEFEEATRSWKAVEWCRGFNGNDGYPRYRGADGMRSIVEEIVKSIPEAVIQQKKKVVSIEKKDDCLKVLLEDGSSHMCKEVVLTSPMHQSLEMCKSLDFPEKKELEKIAYDKTISLQVSLSKESKIQKPGAIQKPMESIHIICDNKRKGISKENSVTIHCDPEFSEQHFNDNEKDIERMVLQKTTKYFEEDSVISVSVHKWR